MLMQLCVYVYMIDLFISYVFWGGISSQFILSTSLNKFYTVSVSNRCRFNSWRLQLVVLVCAGILNIDTIPWKVSVVDTTWANWRYAEGAAASKWMYSWPQLKYFLIYWDSAGLRLLRSDRSEGDQLSLKNCRWLPGQRQARTHHQQQFTFILFNASAM